MTKIDFTVFGWYLVSLKFKKCRLQAAYIWTWFLRCLCDDLILNLITSKNLTQLHSSVKHNQIITSWHDSSSFCFSLNTHTTLDLLSGYDAMKPFWDDTFSDDGVNVGLCEPA